MARCSNCGCNRLNYGIDSWICENCGTVVVGGKEKKLDKNSWTYKFGSTLGCIIALCATVAIMAAIMALTYKFGSTLGCIIALCATVAIMALTYKLIFWLFALYQEGHDEKL